MTDLETIDDELPTHGSDETLIDAPDQPDDAPVDDVADAPDAPEPDDATEPELDDDGNPVAPLPPPEPEPTPWEVKVMGAKWEADKIGIKGAKLKADGTVVIPPEGRDRLSQLVSKGRMYEEKVPQQLHAERQRAIAAETAFNEQAERGTALYSFFSELADKSEQEIYDFLLDWNSKKPLLQAQTERAVAKAERDAMERRMTAGYAPNAASENVGTDLIVQEASERAWNEAQQLAGKVKGLKADDALEIANALWADRQAWYIDVAQQDDPQSGIRRGQPVFRADRWRKDFLQHAELRTQASRTLTRAATVAPKLSAAAQTNAAAVRPAAASQTRNAPPPPPAGAASGRAGRPAAPKTKAEYDALERAALRGAARVR